MSKIDKSLTVGVEIEYPSSSASFVIRRMSLTLAKCSILDHFRYPAKMVSFYCLITEYFATASPMIWMESQLSELKIIGGYCGFMDTRVQPSGFL